MKKLLSIVMALLAVFALAMTGCKTEEESKPIIRLRSQAQQYLKVGDSMEIVYSLHNNTSDSVTFVSENTDVVEVDKFGNVDAVGVGETDVKLTLDEDTSVSVSVHYTVTKNFFMTDDKHVNGIVNLKGQDTSSDVYITSGQAQVLVNAAGEEWYFKTHLDHTGYSNGDLAGAWGVGSFLVDNAHNLGNVMFWYELRRKDDDNHAQLYFGGYRYETTIEDAGGHYQEAVSTEKIDVSEGVDLTLYRQGTMHYFMLEYPDNGETKTIKHCYDVPLFDGLETFPGVYGQEQKLTISNYSSTNVKSEVQAKLLNFQKAEDIKINVVDNRLVAGKTYQLTSSIQPAYTTDKNITYTLKNAQNGVALTPDGKITIADGVADVDITVVATATNAQTVSDERNYRIIARPVSESEILDTGMVVGTVDLTQNGYVSSSESYMPLICDSENWYAEAVIKGNIFDARAALMAVTDGYGDYFTYGLNYVADKRNGSIDYGDFNGKTKTIASSSNGGLGTKTNTLGLLKNGNDLLMFINGKQIKRHTTTVQGKLYPVIYTARSGIEVSDVRLVTDSEEVSAIVAENPFSVGRLVTVNNGSYKLGADTLSGGGDYNWPPVNDYENGLKFNSTFKGGCTIQFTMSDVKVKQMDEIDSKILVYLKSEATTCSIQFVIKDRDGDGTPECKLCVNLNDASWSEHDIPAELEESILKGTTQVKIVKTMTEVEVWINGTRLFEGRNFMDNFNYWNESTLATPGIGSFNCGLTLTDVSLSR